MEKNNKKWFEFARILDFILLIFPPLAVYGFLKNKKISKSGIITFTGWLVFLFFFLLLKN